MNQISVSFSQQRVESCCSPAGFCSPVAAPGLAGDQLTALPCGVEGGGTGSLGEGSGHGRRPDTGVPSPLVPKSRLPFNVASVDSSHHGLGSALRAVAI